jgi:LAO/AO transport system kinase
MEKPMEALIDMIMKKTGEDKKISCRDALEISRVLEISPAQVGKELNRLKIKIKSCQLGCF